MIKKKLLKIGVFYIVLLSVLIGLFSACQNKPKEPDEIIIYHYNALIDIAKKKEREKDWRQKEILHYWSIAKDEIRSAVKSLEQLVKNTYNIEIDEKLELVYDSLRTLNTILYDEGISLDN